MAAMQGQLTNIQQFCMAIGHSPHPPATPPHGNSTCPTIAMADAMVVGMMEVMAAATAVAASHNNQPGLAATEPAHSNQVFLPLPISIGKIGTTATPMAAMWTMPTQAQHVAIAAQPTIPMQAVPTSWAAQQLECTRPSSRQHVAASHRPPRCPPQQQLPQQCPPCAYYPTQGTNAPPAYFGAIQPAGGTYRQRMTMAMPVIQPGQTMMNFVGQQFPPSAGATQMM